ncbi:MAG: DUF2325 domain-containing protein [Leptolyngbya sp. SIO4C1]|nr:DUF2325 domain-containing protein [Leptolyngbya sp. SIO4C1]
MTNRMVACLKKRLIGSGRQLKIMLRGLSGEEYRQNRYLLMRLAALRADYNRLTQELNELIDYTDREIAQLKGQNSGLTQAQEALQLRVWDLEEQIEALLEYIANEFVKVEETSLPADADVPDLSKLHLALVGGHDATRREVIRELTEQYGLQKWVELPPFAHSSLVQIRPRIQRCDLIIVITRYMNHQLTDSINRLKASGGLMGEVVLVNCRGKTGVIREILKRAT